MEKYIDNNKIKIFVREKLVENSSKAILLIHGFGEHGGRYEEFISVLNKEGYSVFAMDLRGHGKTISKKGDLESIKKVIKDTELVMDYIKENYNFKTIGVFGHSTGGLVASLYTSFNNDKVNFLILSSPAVYCPKKFKIIRLLPYRFLKFISIKKEFNGDEESLKNFSIRSIGVIFKEGVNWVNKHLNIKAPTLLVCAKKDDLLDEYENFGVFYNKLNNDKNKFIMYEDAKHRIVHNDGYEKRVKDIVSWICDVVKEG